MAINPPPEPPQDDTPDWGRNILTQLSEAVSSLTKEVVTLKEGKAENVPATQSQGTDQPDKQPDAGPNGNDKPEERKPKRRGGWIFRDK